MPLGGASELYRSFYACWIKALQVPEVLLPGIEGKAGLQS